MTTLPTFIVLVLRMEWIRRLRPRTSAEHDDGTLSRHDILCYDDGTWQCHTCGKHGQDIKAKRKALRTKAIDA